MAEHARPSPRRRSFEGWTCPLPLRDSPTIVMGHGGGGAMSAELVDHVFLPAFADVDARRSSATPRCSRCAGGRLAFSTDSFVVRPLFFPGGSIGDLAVNGTVNDLAMSGAQALFLSAAFILEEGTDITQVGAVAQRLGEAATRAGVRVVTGDTKVVESGHGDGVYVNTAGVGLVPDGVDIRPDRAGAGRRRHRERRHRRARRRDHERARGAAVRHRGRERLPAAERAGRGDAGGVRRTSTSCATRPAAGSPPRSTRSPRPRRSASASTSAGCPIPEVVANACAFLGLDPLQVANEGKLLAFVPGRRGRRRARRRCARTRPARAPCVIGEVRRGPPRHGLDHDRLRRLAGRRPADRRAAAADLLTDA